MSVDTWEKLLLVVVGTVFGSAMTGLGAWLNDRRGEKRRKGTKLEEAYIGWLNSHPLVILRLKEVADLADDMSVSIDSHKLLLEKLDRLKSDLLSLLSALNVAFVYERDERRKEKVEFLLRGYTKLVEILTLIVLQYKDHLAFHDVLVEFQVQLDKANAMVSHVEHLKAAGTKPDPQLTKEADKVDRYVRRQRNGIAKDVNKANKLISERTVRRSSRVKTFLGLVEELDNEALNLRGVLTVEGTTV